MDEIRIIQSRTRKDPRIFMDSFQSGSPDELNRMAFAVLAAADASLKDSPLAAEYTAVRLTAFVRENEKAFYSLPFEDIAERFCAEARSVGRELSHIASVKGYSYRAGFTAFLVIQNSFLCMMQGDSPAFVIDGPIARRVGAGGTELSIYDGILQEGSALLITSASFDGVIPRREVAARLSQCNEKALSDMCDLAARRGIQDASAIIISSVKAGSQRGAGL